jgi:hypothetical protein
MGNRSFSALKLGSPSIDCVYIVTYGLNVRKHSRGNEYRQQ